MLIISQFVDLMNLECVDEHQHIYILIHQLESNISVLGAARYFSSTSSSVSSLPGALMFVYVAGVLRSISPGAWDVLCTCIAHFSHICRVPSRRHRRRGWCGSFFPPCCFLFLGVASFVCLSICMYVSLYIYLCVCISASLSVCRVVVWLGGVQGRSVGTQEGSAVDSARGAAVGCGVGSRLNSGLDSRSGNTRHNSGHDTAVDIDVPPASLPVSLTVFCAWYGSFFVLAFS